MIWIYFIVYIVYTKGSEASSYNLPSSSSSKECYDLSLKKDLTDGNSKSCIKGCHICKTIYTKSRGNWHCCIVNIQTYRQTDDGQHILSRKDYMGFQRRRAKIKDNTLASWHSNKFVHFSLVLSNLTVCKLFINVLQHFLFNTHNRCKCSQSI